MSEQIWWLEEDEKCGSNPNIQICESSRWVEAAGAELQSEQEQQRGTNTEVTVNPAKTNGGGGAYCLYRNLQ